MTRDDARKIQQLLQYLVRRDADRAQSAGRAAAELARTSFHLTGNAPGKVSEAEMAEAWPAISQGKRPTPQTDAGILAHPQSEEHSG